MVLLSEELADGVSDNFLKIMKEKININFTTKKTLGYIFLIFITCIGYGRAISAQDSEPTTIYIRNDINSNIRYYSFQPTIWTVDGVFWGNFNKRTSI